MKLIFCSEYLNICECSCSSAWTVLCNDKIVTSWLISSLRFFILDLWSLELVIFYSYPHDWLIISIKPTCANNILNCITLQMSIWKEVRCHPLLCTGEVEPMWWVACIGISYISKMILIFRLYTYLSMRDYILG